MIGFWIMVIVFVGVFIAIQLNSIHWKKTGHSIIYKRSVKPIEDFLKKYNISYELEHDLDFIKKSWWETAITIHTFDKKNFYLTLQDIEEELFNNECKNCGRRLICDIKKDGFICNLYTIDKRMINDEYFYKCFSDLDNKRKTEERKTINKLQYNFRKVECDVDE